MKIARLALAAAVLLAAVACSRGAPTEPVAPSLEGPRGNVGMLGSGSISSDPVAPLTLPPTLSD